MLRRIFFPPFPPLAFQIVFPLNSSNILSPTSSRRYPPPWRLWQTQSPQDTVAPPCGLFEVHGAWKSFRVSLPSGGHHVGRTREWWPSVSHTPVTGAAVEKSRVGNEELSSGSLQRLSGWREVSVPRVCTCVCPWGTRVGWGGAIHRPI